MSRTYWRKQKRKIVSRIMDIGHYLLLKEAPLILDNKIMNGAVII